MVACSKHESMGLFSLSSLPFREHSPSTPPYQLGPYQGNTQLMQDTYGGIKLRALPSSESGITVGCPYRLYRLCRTQTLSVSKNCTEDLCPNMSWCLKQQNS